MRFFQAPASPSRELTARVLAKVSTVMGGSVAAKAIGLLTTFLIVRNISPADYAYFGVMDTVTSVAGGLISAGLNWCMISSVARVQGNRREM